MPIAQVNKCISCRTAKLGRSCKRMLFTIHDHRAIPSAGCLNFLWQGATSITLGWFAGQTWRYNNWYA